jgi:modification methylase
MNTRHQVLFADAREMASVSSRSVHLVVTSPPYPMIEMWDLTFSAANPAIARSLEDEKGWAAFEKMHQVLDPVWKEVHRVLVPGGIACINVGDATRTVGEAFALYPNHARILTRLLKLGFTPLPTILWRKQTNAPNKFMGSGMLPAGAYVTLEHEHILIVRKGGKRAFLDDTGKRLRRQSAFFWEERNQWFSDVWFDLKGTQQVLVEKDLRERSGAFPFELPYRLISMFSVKGDTVLDPFLGTGTNMLAAMAAARSSIGFELEQGFEKVIESQAEAAVEIGCARIAERLEAHVRFVEARHEKKENFLHRNVHYGFPVVTGQETELLLSEPAAARRIGAGEFEVEYRDAPSITHFGEWDRFFTNRLVERQT